MPYETKRLALAGQTYTARSLTTAAQTCVNLYAEKIEDPNERAKGNAALYGTPGRHLLKDLTTIDAAAHPIRAIWSGRGRLIVAAGTKYMELDSSFNLVGSVRTIANPTGEPAQFFFNGNDLLIISGTVAYIDVGAGPVTITFNAGALTGTLTPLDLSPYFFVDWDSGDGFTPALSTITIAGTAFTIAQFISGSTDPAQPGRLRLTASAVFTITAATNANPVVFTKTAHGLTTGTVITLFGGTGAWSAVNGSFVITSTGANTFSIPVDSTAFGALTGTITASGLPFTATPAFNALSAAFLDGFYIVTQLASRTFYVSGLNDGTQWSALDFGVKESYTDYIRRVIKVNEQLLFFGTETFEWWQNTGNPTGSPFSRINGATGQVGTISTWSPIVCGDGKCRFLGTNTDGQIVAYEMRGYTPYRISTHAEESSWNDGNAPTNAWSYSYTEEGHQFWVFHIGTACWAYDITTGFWATRAGFDGSAFTTYPTYFHTFIAEFGVGKHITGGLLDGKLYESSVNFYDDDGSNIRRQRVLPYLYAGGNMQFLGRMTLEMQTGTVASGAAPDVSREFSDDRGNTWNTAQPASMGVHNDYSLRVFWPGGGASRDRLTRLTITGQSKVALVALDCDVEAGAA